MKRRWKNMMNLASFYSVSYWKSMLFISAKAHHFRSSCAHQCFYHKNQVKIKIICYISMGYLISFERRKVWWSLSYCIYFKVLFCPWFLSIKALFVNAHSPLSLRGVKEKRSKYSPLFFIWELSYTLLVLKTVYPRGQSALINSRKCSIG